MDRPAVNYNSEKIEYDVLGPTQEMLGDPWGVHGVAVSPTSINIAVTNLNTNNVLIYMHGRNGSSPGEFGSKGSTRGQLMYPRGVVYNSRDQVVVSDSGNHRLQTFTERGDVINEIGSQGNTAGQFDSPCGIAAHGVLLYVADRDNHRIQVLTEDGRFVREFVTRDESGDWKPQDVVVTQRGDVIVAVCGEEPGQLMTFSPEGHHRSSVCTGEPGSVALSMPYGVTVDGEDNMIVTDYRTHQIHVVTQTGQLLRTLGGKGDEPGKFSGPCGVSFDREGRVIVADQGSSRVQIIKFK